MNNNNNNNQSKLYQQQQIDPLLPFYCYPDSQLYKIHILPSSIPNSGMGLFASKLIHPNQKILQYYGSIIKSPFSNDPPFQMQNKMVYINYLYCVISRGPASRANDIVKWEPQKYNNYQNKILRQKKMFKIIQNKSRNAKIQCLDKDKAFIIATEEIKKGQEIFVDYGFQYWDFFMKRAASQYV